MPATQRKKSNTEVTPGDKNVSLTDQLDRAQAAVERSHMSALALHSQWRTHLLRLSYIVIIVTLHQMQTPTSACIKEIKHWNEIKRNSMEEPISGTQAFFTVLNDSHVEVLSVICAACLVWCLSLPMENRDFSTLPYRLSCAVIPMIVSLYFQNKHLGCIPAEEKQYMIENPSITDHNNENEKRAFPIILVFHTIVSISLFFMQYQCGQHEQNVEMVKKMRKDLLDAQKSKKKT